MNQSLSQTFRESNPLLIISINVSAISLFNLITKLMKLATRNLDKKEALPLH